MRRGVIMKFKFRLAGVTVLATREIIGCINASGLTVNVTASDAFALSRWRLGTDADIRREIR